MAKKTLKDLEVAGKKVLVRVDFNVPRDKITGEILDDNRIRASLETIQYLLDQKAILILMSHLGRPKGEAKKELSLEKVAKHLSSLLDQTVLFLQSDQVIDDDVVEKVKNLKEGQVALLENTRFVPGEEKNDPEFAKKLASLADFYVNDAFGTSHRAHASNVGVSSYLPSALGFLVEKEVEIMGKALKNPTRPFVAILGGAKVSDKIGVIENLLDKVDKIIVGGGMSYTFLKAMGKEIGKSLLEEDKVEFAKNLLEQAEEKKVDFLLPLDAVVAEELKADIPVELVDVDSIPSYKMGLDIGPKTIECFTEALKDAKTVVWNGPMGVFEIEEFSNGTLAIAKALSKLEATTIVGGGDSAAAVEESGFKDQITHVSTGGGASLEFLEGRVLPAIDAISDR